MTNLFLLALSLSLSGSILALLLFALRPLTARRLSRTWQYYVWLVVLLRFLLPLTPQLGMAGALVRTIQGAVTAQSADPAPQPETGGSTLIDGGMPPGEAQPGDWTGGANSPPQPGQEAAPTSAWPTLLPYAGGVWLGAALFLLAYKAAAYRSFVRFARAGAVEVTGGRLHSLYLDQLAMSNIKGRLPLYINDLISSPMLVGVLRPAVILPDLELGEEALRHILRHELTHHKRLDGLYKWLAQLVLCLHWFNPLAYLVAGQLGKDCELACDEAVVKQLDTGGRRGYGDALLASLGAQGRYGSSIISLTMSEDAGTIRERLDAIAGYRARTPAARAAGALLCVLLLCGFAATGAYTGTEPVLGNNSLAAPGPQTNATEPIGRGTRQAPEDIRTLTARAGSHVGQTPNLEIVIQDGAAVNLTPTADQEISVAYGESLYDVSIDQKNGDWRIRIAYTGSYAVYPAATLRLPDLAYGEVNLYAEQATVYFDGVLRQGGTLNTHTENCSVFFTVPAGFGGTLNATAPSSYFQLHTQNGYENCDIAIANCATFGSIPDGFVKQGDSLVYRHGTGAGTLRIDMAGNGYATIETANGGLPEGTVAGELDGLTLVEQEYTLAQLREQNIWGVKVAAASEQVRVSTGGQTLKLQYYQAGSGDYTLETVSDRGGTIRELYLLRNAATLDDTLRSIHITIPDGFACDVLHITTADGAITLDGCRANVVMLQSESGRIWVNGGGVEDRFAATSDGGGIDITGTALPPGAFANNLQTGSGTVRLRLPMPSSEYTYKIDAGSGARIQIGGVSHSGGSAYTVGGGAAGTIKFTSESGTLLVEDQ